MYNPQSMSLAQSGGDLRYNIDCLVDRKRARISNVFLQVEPIDVFHDQEMRSITFMSIERRNHIRMR